MNELIEKIRAQIEAAGGRVLYSAVYATLTHQELRLVPQALKQAKANGTFRRDLVWNSEEKQNDLFLTTEPAPEEQEA